MDKEVYTIFVRGNKFLNWRFKWVDTVPDLFPSWQVKAVEKVMFHPNNKTPPTGYAEVTGKVIDLDNLTIIPTGGTCKQYSSHFSSLPLC